jgi:hypothetical protein
VLGVGLHCRACEQQEEVLTIGPESQQVIVVWALGLARLPRYARRRSTL